MAMRIHAIVYAQVPDSADPDYVSDAHDETSLEIISDVSSYKDNIVMVRLGGFALLIDKADLIKAVDLFRD